MLLAGRERCRVAGRRRCPRGAPLGAHRAAELQVIVAPCGGRRRHPGVAAARGGDASGRASDDGSRRGNHIRADREGEERHLPATAARVAYRSCGRCRSSRHARRELHLPPLLGRRSRSAAPDPPLGHRSTSTPSLPISSSGAATHPHVLRLEARRRRKKNRYFVDLRGMSGGGVVRKKGGGRGQRRGEGEDGDGERRGRRRGE